MQSRTPRALAALAAGMVITLAAIVSGGLDMRPAHAATDCGTTADGGFVTVTFCYNGTTGADGSAQSWTVPAGVTSVSATAYGAPGGWAFDGSAGGLNTPGGAGGTASGQVSVTPGDTWTIKVGGNGGDQATVDDSTFGAGGYNGGANGWPGSLANAVFGGAGGGGATSLVGSGATIIAGGGGGANTNAPGGDGGGTNGQQGYNQVNQFAGGTGATGSTHGTGQGTTGCNDGSVAASNGADAPAGTGGIGGYCAGFAYAGPGGGGGYAGGGGGTNFGAGGGSGLVTGALNPALSTGGNFDGFAYATITFAQPPSTTTLSASQASPLDISGGAVTVQYTATVTTTAGAAVTEGAVEFMQDGSDVAGCASLAVDANGKAVCEITYSAAGSHTIDALYTDPPGDGPGGVFPDSDDSFTMIVGGPPAAPSFSSSGITRTATLGVPFTYTSPAPSGSPPPVIAAGGVTVSDPSVTYTTSGNQVTITSPGPVGTNTVKVTVTNGISPDATFTITINVAKQDTTTAIVSSDSSSVYGEPITFTATVHPADSNDTASPGGTVTFRDGTTDLCSAVAVSAVSPATTPPTATASCTLAAGSTALAALHNGTNATITADYSGDATFNSSTDTTTQAVTAANTATSLVVATPPSSAAATSSVYGQRITLTATVTAGSPSTINPGADPDSTRAGGVDFSYDGTSIAGCQDLAVDASTNQATCVLDAFTNASDLAALHAGGHTLLTQYSSGANGDYASSEDSVAFTVTGAATTTHLGVVTPPYTFEVTNAVYGQPITLVATVNANSPSTLDPSGAAGGVVSFSVDSSPIAGCQLVPLANGSNQAACVLDATTNAAVLAAMHVGGHALLASYTHGAVADYLTSEGGLAFTVGPATTTTTLAAAPNPAAFGEAVLLTATVTQDPASVIPPSSGSVEFDNLTTTEVPCVNTVAAGVAQCGIAAGHLAVGSYNFIASYDGSKDYVSSASGLYTEVVSAAPTTTTASAVYDDFAPVPTVAITAEVHALPPSVTDPGDIGTVSFFNGTTLLCTVPLDDNQAICEAAIDPSNTSPHSLTAIYNSDASTANYLASSATTDAVVHLARPTIVTVGAVPDSQAALGASWLVSGGGFSGTYSVTICGIAVPFTVINDNTLLVGIPSVGAPRQCVIVVTAAGGVGSSDGTVTVVPQPQPGAVPVTIPGGSPSTPSATCNVVTLTLSGQWTLIGWPGADTAVADALAASPDGCTTDVSSAIAVIWSFDSASQTWLAYFPGVTVPGANDLETLQRGMGYFVALNNPSNSVTWTVDTVPPDAG